MARPLRIEYPGAFYHVTARGNELRNIFESTKDHEKFLSYIETATLRYKATIHAYCLMSNHYHLLIETPLGNLSQIMHHINGAYTTFFNTGHQRTGHLLQGRYKAILVDADAYTAELSRYLHLNPVRANMVKKPDEYLWTSYQFYTGQKKKPGWLKTDLVLSYFGRNIRAAQKSYRKFVLAGIDKEYDSPLKKTVASTILGSIDFVDRVKAKYLNGKKKADRNLPDLAKLSQAPTIKEIHNEIKKILNDDPTLSRKATIYLCHRYSRRTLQEIGDHFGIGESAVSQASRRLQASLGKDRKLRKKIEGIGDRLNLCNV